MILFVEDLTVIDFSYLCPKRGMLGESWIVDIELEGGLDHQNMVLDFGLVKKQIKSVIDDTVDHRLVIPKQSSTISIVEKSPNVTDVYFDNKDKKIALSCPNEAYTILNSETITKDVVISYLKSVLMPVLPDNVKALNITLRQEDIKGASYHYSHGLKKHDGNCQRIAHGHRSTIQIFRDGTLDSALNTKWAERWNDIYLGSEEDLVDSEALSLDASFISQDMLCFKYVANQGLFELSISKSHSELIDRDTTVECLAEYISEQLKEKNPSSAFKVRAFEGVGKGAIANA